MVKRNKVYRVSFTELERALEKAGLPKGARIVSLDHDVKHRDAVMIVWSDRFQSVDAREDPPEERLGKPDDVAESQANPRKAPVEALRIALNLVRKAVASDRNRIVLRRAHRGGDRDMDVVDVEDAPQDLTVVLDEDGEG